MKKQLFIVGLAILCLIGCSTPKQMTMFTGQTASSVVPQPEAYTIDPGDVLQIVFTTISGEGANPYNSAGTRYVVYNDSTVTIPILGRINVAGLTTKELAHYLEQRLVGQIKQPIVLVEIENATVSVLGAVVNPTRLSAIHPIRLTEALSVVGGPTKYARLDNVLVQRSEGGVLKSYRINLNKDDLTQSPCYYLRKGDVLYLAPRFVK